MVRNLCTDCVRLREIPLYIEGIYDLIYIYIYIISGLRSGMRLLRKPKESPTLPF